MKRVVAVKHDRVLFAEENDHDNTRKFLTLRVKAEEQMRVP